MANLRHCFAPGGESHPKGRGVRDVALNTTTGLRQEPVGFNPRWKTWRCWVPHWKSCCSDPVYQSSPLSADVQLQSEAPATNLQNNPQPFNDRKRSGFLSSLLRVRVGGLGCVCTEATLVLG